MGWRTSGQQVCKVLAQSRPLAPGIQSGQGLGLERDSGQCPWVPSLAPTCSKTPSRCHSISGAGSPSTEHSRTSCPGARPTTKRGPWGPIMFGGAGQGREGMRDGLAPAGPILPPSPAFTLASPTLNPDPEALLSFTSRVLGQASVQPSIAHLGMEQGEQLPPAPACPPPDRS